LNSEAITVAASAGLVMAIAWREDGRTPKRAREAEAGSTDARLSRDATAAPARARMVAENFILEYVEIARIDV